MAVLRWIGTGLLFLVVALCLAIVIIPPFLDRIYYEGPASDHYDGARFFNPDGDDMVASPTGGSRASFFWRQLTGSDQRPPWPETVAVTPSKPAVRVTGDAMVATWVGHATVLVQANGLNILTDPIWSRAAGPFGVGPGRVAEPGIRFEDLPKIDLVVVSHNHYDHMDLVTLKRLWDRDKPMIVTSLGNDSVIAEAGVPSKALDWGRGLRVGGAEVFVNRNHHWGSRWGVDRNRALWSSFVVALPGGNIFFAGDTGFGDGQWPVEAANLGPVRLAIIPIGAFRFQPGQMRTGSHVGPGEAVEVFRRLGASTGLGMHWGTFRLSFEAYDTPPKMMALFAKCAGFAADAFRTTKIGEPFAVPPYAPPVMVRGDAGPCRENSEEMQALK